MSYAVLKFLPLRTTTVTVSLHVKLLNLYIWYRWCTI